MVAVVTRVRARRPAVLVVIVAAVLALVGCGGSGRETYGGFSFVSPDGRTDIAYPIAQRGVVEDLSGPDVTSDTTTLALSDWAGQVVVINIWGSWCGPCRAEADDLNRAATALADQGVQFLGINVRDNRGAAADFLKVKQVPYPSVFDPSMRTLLAVRGYPTSAIPSTLVLDRQRRVAYIFLRVVTADELIAVVGAVAAEPATDPAVTTGSGEGS